MIPLRLDQVADVVGGELESTADAARVVDSVGIDSRTIRPGGLFVALAGERTDGHAFVGDALARGAAGYLAEAGRALPPAASGLAAGLAAGDRAGAVVVDDPADALTGLGAWVRQQVDPTVVAVTGSSGKTTTKDFIAAAIAGARNVVANPGSYNNELGVPLTCCLLEPRSEVLVAEVGARGLGHIAALAGGVLVPDVAVITMVGPSHLELFGDIKTVAEAKSELVESLDPSGVAVLNADDPHVAAMATRAPGRVVTYGRDAGADWRASDVGHDDRARAVFTVAGPPGRAQVRLPLPGAHNVGNALAALAAADACGVDLDAAVAGLAGATVSRWRMQCYEAPGGLVVLNDAYNANPSSMAAALATLTALATAGRRWAVLGQMAELGPGGTQAHEEVGRRCADLRIDGLVVVGADAAAIGVGARRAGFDGAAGLHLVHGPEAAAALVADLARPGDVVLVKASRAVGLERVAAALAGAAA